MPERLHQGKGPEKQPKEKWKMTSLLGPWYGVSVGREFRFYIRENQAGERYFFADYRQESTQDTFICII
jgi:hypothetical protein